MNKNRGVIYKKIDASVFAGPATWHFLHSTAATYDGSDSSKRGFISIIDGIQKTFPCPNCRKNLAKHLKELPLEKYLDNCDDLFLWTYLMHDKVNQLKHVKSPPLNEVKKYYFNTLGVICQSCT